MLSKLIDRLTEQEAEDNYLFEPPYPIGVSNPRARVWATLIMIVAVTGACGIAVIYLVHF